MRFLEYLRDQNYQEEPTSTVTHDGAEYSVNRILELSRSLPATEFPIDYLKWMMGTKPTKSDKKRIDGVDLAFPIIVTPWNNQYVIIDGWHRVAKALEAGLTHIPARIIFSDILALSKKEST